MLVSKDVNKIVDALSNGRVVAVKTDTVYGLVCDAFNKSATEKIYSIKRRETQKPISIFVKNLDDIKQYVDNSVLNKEIIELMEKYWPGALTIILKKKQGILDNITCNFDSIGIRIPNDSFLLSVLDRVSFPLAQTSCNISGEQEYTDAHTINEKFGDEIDYIVDGGKILNNVASTIIKIDNNNIHVIRQGDIIIDERYKN